MKQIFSFLISVGVIILLAVIIVYSFQKNTVKPRIEKNLPVIIVGATPPGSLDLASRIIRKNGWDKEAGFLLELRPIFPEGAVLALTNRTVDVISISPLTAVNLVNQKNPIVFIANGLKLNCPFFVNQSSQATTWQDLKGTRLGTPSETGPAFTTFKVIMKAKEGIAVDDYFNISHSTAAELISRLTRKEIDGAYGRCSEVGIAMAIEDAKFKTIGNFTDIAYRDEDFDELMVDGVVVSKDWIKSNNELVKKFQELLYKTYAYIKDHPEVYDQIDIKKAYAIEDSSPNVIAKIKELVPSFYTFVEWPKLINSQYKFFELAKQEKLLENLPPSEELFYNTNK